MLLDILKEHDVFLCCVRLRWRVGIVTFYELAEQSFIIYCKGIAKPLPIDMTNSHKPTLLVGTQGEVVDGHAVLEVEQ